MRLEGVESKETNITVFLYRYCGEYLITFDFTIAKPKKQF